MTSWDTDRPLFEAFMLEHFPETCLETERADLVGDEYYIDPETNKQFKIFVGGLSFQKYSE
jgi:hypothetical protein